MSRISRALVALVLALSATSCASWAEPPVEDPSYPAHARFGATATEGPIQWLSGLPTITGASQTITLFDMTGGSTATRQLMRNVNRIVFTGRCDQAITLKYQTLATGSTTWRTRNGFTGTAPTGDCTGSSPGALAGHTVPATTDVACDFLVLGPDSKLVAVTGTSPTCEYDIGLVSARSLGM